MFLKAASLVFSHPVNEKKNLICFQNGKLTVRKEIEVVMQYGIVRFSQCVDYSHNIYEMNI